MMTVTELKLKSKLEGNMFTLVYRSWLNWDKLPDRLSEPTKIFVHQIFTVLFPKKLRRRFAM